MRYAKPLNKALCLACAAMLAVGYGGIDVARAFGDPLEPEAQEGVVEEAPPAESEPGEEAPADGQTPPEGQTPPDDEPATSGAGDEAPDQGSSPVAESNANEVAPPSDASPAEAGIPIDAAHFPDANFLAAVQEIAGGGDVLTQAVIDETTGMGVENRKIQDLTGIEYFTALTWLDCSGNWLEKLDTSGNPALTELYCNGNYLKKLDTSGNSALTELYCNGNYYLEELITSGNSALAYLDCSDNHLPRLDLSGNPALEYLDCSDNRLPRLDLSGNKALIDLDCSDNRLTSIDLSKNTSLKNVEMSEQIVSLENFSAPYDLKDLDPNIDAGRIKDVQGATLEGAVLTSCTPGTVVSYSYKTGLQIGSTDLLLSVVLEPMGALDLVISTRDGKPAPADEYKMGDGVLTVKGSGSYLIRMASYCTSSKNRIVIAKGASPTITFDHLVLQGGEGSCIDIKPGAGDVTLYIQDRALLIPEKGAGILKNNGEASLTVAADPKVKGDHFLQADGTPGYPGIGACGAGTGIGSGQVTTCKNITLKGLSLKVSSAIDSAVFGHGAAGIGGGFGISEVSNITIDGCTTYDDYSENIKGGIGSAAIGSGRMTNTTDVSVSNIVIKDSTIKAVGGAASAGIGAGANGYGGDSSEGGTTVSNITIVGSDVEAEASSYSAGIGAGPCENGAVSVSDISIKGSFVRAWGDQSGAGIGSSWAAGNNAVSNITIVDSKVGSFSDTGGPGIGSGYSDTGNSSLSNVLITGGSTVGAWGGDSETPENGGAIGAGPGIGSGHADQKNSTVSNIVIDRRAQVRAHAGDDGDEGGGAAGIGGGPAPNGTSSAQGVVLKNGYVEALGARTTADGLGLQTLPAIGAGSAKERVSSDNAIEPGEGTWARAFKANSQEEWKEVYPSKPWIDYSFEHTSLDDVDEYMLMALVWQGEVLACSGTDADYHYDSGLLVITGSGTYTVTMSDPAENTTENPDGAAANAFSIDPNLPYPPYPGIVVAEGASPTVVLKDVAIDVSDADGRCAFLIEEDALDTTVLLSGENVLKSGNGCAGIQKDSGDDAKLTVSSNAGAGSTEGSLDVKGGDGAAGIGGGKTDVGDGSASNIEIAGGTVKASAGHGGGSGRSAAGIGGGSTTAASGNADARNIVISGGDVRAQGTSSNSGAGAGIGGGTPGSSGHANASDILVSGGTVEAVGGHNGGAGIGAGAGASGCESIAERISITGGNVTATGGNSGAGIGSGYTEGVGNDSRAQDISVSGGTVKATAGSVGGAAGIGSGQTYGGSSIACNIAISGGSVEAAGATGEDHPGQLYFIQGGAGIGSGCASPRFSDEAVGETRAENITISGGAVIAQGGVNSPGIGSGTCSTDFAFTGTSTATGIRLAGGTVTATGGPTHARESDKYQPLPNEIASVELIGDLKQLPAVGAGLAVTRTCEDAVVDPGTTLVANAWKGSSAEEAERFLTDATEAASIAEMQDPYLRAEFSARPGADPENPEKPSQSNPDQPSQPGDSKSLADGQALASTGDGLLPIIAGLVALLIAAAGAVAVGVVRARRRRG